MTELIWDIQDEHLDEAEFLLETWTKGLDSPTLGFAKLRDGPERRLIARIDGLLVGGPIVVERLLLPVLAEPDDDEFRTAAATLAIVQGTGLDACARVLTAFDDAKHEGRRGLVRGLQLAQRAGLIAWLGRDLERLTGPVLAARLAIFSGHRVDTGAWLSAWLRTEDLEVCRAAVELARHTGAPEVLRLLVPSMRAEDDVLRRTALESALIRGLPGAWEAMCGEAFGRRDRAALAWVARLGGEATHRRLLAELAASPTPELVWAAGQTGRIAAIDLAIDLLEHRELARLAGEVICAIGGLSMSEDRFWLDRGVPVGAEEDDALPNLADDELEANLIPSGEDSLRAPNPDEIRAWWAQRRDGFQPNARHSMGRPLDVAQLARSLQELPNRRRVSLALELAARTHGRAQLCPRVFTAEQLAQTNAIFAALGPLDLQGGL
jgi:uncharacterized protein (TIGR02270 family)